MVPHVNVNLKLKLVSGTSTWADQMCQKASCVDVFLVVVDTNVALGTGNAFADWIERRK